MTLYHVPHLALGAELSTDYIERTAIVGYRTVFGVVGGAGTALIGFAVFFAGGPEFENGQPDPAAYPRFAMTGALIMLTTIWLSAIGTHKQIPYLPQASPGQERFSFGRVLREAREALESRSFRALFTGLVIFAVLSGMQATLLLHMGTHFYRMTPEQIQIYIVAIIVGSACGIPCTRLLNIWIDKKPTLFVGVFFGTTFTGTPPLLGVLGLLPPSTDPLMMIIICACAGIGAFFTSQAGVTGSSIMADVADEHEVRTGRRQEGIFFGAISFSGKAAHGLGISLAGFGVDLIGFPTQAAPGSVGPEVLTQLGLFYGPVVWLLSLFALGFYNGIHLNRQRVAEIHRKLAER